MTYQLPSGGLTWSSVFRQIEANKERLGIIDYSVSQTTLEQVSPQTSTVTTISTAVTFNCVIFGRYLLTLLKNKLKKIVSGSGVITAIMINI